MGTYFQVQVTLLFLLPITIRVFFATTDISLFDINMFFLSQDDYLDCYGEPEFIGKVSALLHLPVSSLREYQLFY